MSIDATRWAWRLDGLRPMQKLVLLSLADRADEHHRCHPSIARLSADTGVYRETIMQAIAEMEKMGLVHVARRLGEGSVYTLVGVEDRHEADKPVGKSRPEKQTTPVGENPPVGKTRPVGKSRRHQSEKTDYHQSGKADTESTNEPTKNLNTKTRAKSPPVFSSSDMPEIDSDLATEFIAYRKAKKAPLSPTAWRGICQEAAKANWTVTAAVEEVMTRGWQAFKSEWVQKPGVSNGRHQDNSVPAKIERAIAERNARRQAQSFGTSDGETIDGEFERIPF